MQCHETGEENEAKTIDIVLRCLGRPAR